MALDLRNIALYHHQLDMLADKRHNLVDLLQQIEDRLALLEIIQQAFTTIDPDTHTITLAAGWRIADESDNTLISG